MLLPDLKNAMYHYADLLKTKLRPDMRWLDLGCGHQILPPWFNNRESESRYLIKNCKAIYGIDYDLEALKKHKDIIFKVKGNFKILPFRNDSFDLITANMSIEHASDPASVFREVSRILKKGGFFIMHTPNLYSYLTLISKCCPNRIKSRLVSYIDGRKEQDIFPTYYRSNSKKSICMLVRNNGLYNEEIKMLISTPQFNKFFPLNFAELLCIRITASSFWACFRTNIVAVIKK